MEQINKMAEADAEEILTWKYEAPYDFYNSELTDEALAELLTQNYYVITNSNDERIGFFCLGESAQVPAGKAYGAYPDGFIDIGLGMRPEQTGQGHGAVFFTTIMAYVKQAHPVPLRLTVALFNKRAIRLYEKLGFTTTIQFSNGKVDFMTMTQTITE